MNSIKLSLLWGLLISTYANSLIAQSPSPDWAVKIYGSKGSGTSSYRSMATDKHGNVYALFNEYGYAYADGHSTLDSTSTTLLTSWDCNGNLRWMKSFGATGNVSGYNGGYFLETDTLEGVYISGYAASPQAPSSIYWDTDTIMNVAAGKHISFLIKYNSQGQFQWFNTPVYRNKLTAYNGFSVSPSGEIFLFALLDTGIYNGGSFTINTRRFYAINYAANGNYLATIPLAMSPPSLSGNSGGVFWKFDPAANRFYCVLSFDTTSYGSSLIIGTITIPPPSNASSSSGIAVLGAFTQHGQNLWVRHGSTSKSSSISDIVFGKDGTLYVGGMSEPGNVFCGDTSTNVLGQNTSAHIMALDTNAKLLWSNYSGNNQYAVIRTISYVNNTIVATGFHHGTLSWDNYTITNPIQYTQGYMLRADGATGVAGQLVNISSSATCQPNNAALDKNGNIYLSGAFSGSMIFNNDSLSSNSSSQIHFLLKYKNVICGCDLLQPSFNITGTSAMTYQYTYTGGTPYTSIGWDFGDGSATVSATNPSHTYNSPGTFPVCVTVTNGCGSNTTCKYVTIHPTNVKEFIADDFSVYPTVTENEITIKRNAINEQVNLQLTDIYGKILLQGKMEPGTPTQHLSINQFPAGMYFMKIYNSNGSKCFKVIRK